MKPFRLTLFIILFFYLALLVIVSLNMDSTLSWITNNQAALPYFTLIGMGVFLVIFLTVVYDRKRYQNKIARQEAEKNEIKAKVYEMQRKNEEVDNSIHSFEQSIEKRELPREEPTEPNTDKSL